MVSRSACCPRPRSRNPPQGRPSAILVVDGSGSLGGQIDGINKSVIARALVGDLLADLPADLALGLMRYGHRRRAAKAGSWRASR